MVSPDGQAVVRDWSTGKPGGKNPLQAAVYFWAVAQTLGITTERAEYVYLRSADPARMFGVVMAEPLVPVALSQFDAFERAIAAQVFPLSPGPFCKSCEVRSHCAYGSTLEETS